MSALSQRRLLVDWAPLRKDAAFRWHSAAQLASGLGRESARVTVPLHVYLDSGSVGLVGLVALAQLVAILLASLPAGSVADSRDRRLIVIRSQAAMAVVGLLLVGVSLGRGASLPAVLVLTALLTTLHALEHPATIAVVPSLVPSSRLVAATSLLVITFRTSAMTAPAIAGVLIATFGLPAAYAFTMCAYAAAAVISRGMRIGPHAGGAPVRSPPDSSWGALRSIRRPRALVRALTLDLVATTFGLPMAVYPVLALEIFSVGAAEVGILAAARGAGALALALVSGWVVAAADKGWLIVLSTLAFAALTTILGIPISFRMALILLVFAGAAELTCTLLRYGIVQESTPDALRGRVNALQFLASSTGPRIGDLRAAAMAGSFGAPTAIFAGGILCAATVVALATATKDDPTGREPT